MRVMDRPGAATPPDPGPVQARRAATRDCPNRRQAVPRRDPADLGVTEQILERHQRDLAPRGIGADDPGGRMLECLVFRPAGAQVDVAISRAAITEAIET